MSLLTLLRRRGTAPPPPPPPSEGVPPALPHGDSDSGYPGEPVVRFQPLDGQWETLGVDRLRGLVAQGVVASANDWGADGFSFQLAAEEGASRPDLLPYTPVELEIGGMLVWAGFVWQRPSDANNYQVTCRGWQYHLDDDLLDRVYVHSRTSDFVDQRSLLTADLSKCRAVGDVRSEGTIMLSYDPAAVLGAGDDLVATLDLGPDSVGKRVVMTWESSNNVAGISCYVRGTDTEKFNVASDYNDFFAFALNTGASGTSSGTATTARRFIHIALHDAASTYNPINGNVYLRVTSLKVFRATAYESGGASVLKADTVIKDALATAPLLNQSSAMIQAGTFSLPSYETGGYQTPRAVMESVNALENYRLKLGGDDLKTLIYEAKPLTPIVEVGEWSGAAFSDASVSGEEIYNKAVVDGSGPDGGRLVAKRGAAVIAAALISDVNSGAQAGTVSGPAQVAVIARSPAIFKKGVPYLITLYGGNLDVTGASTFRVRIGSNPAGTSASPPDDYVEFLFSQSVDGAITAQPAQAWYPRQDYGALVAEMSILTGTENSMTITFRAERGKTLPDRRGFPRARRLDINSAVTAAVAERLGDLWLAEHNTAPFSGTLQIVGNGARSMLSGARVAPYEFLRHGGEMIRFGNRLDPDTGAWGRDGRIAGITYRHDDRAVEVSINDQRQRFETILSRYAVLVGG